jgi:hypothetical protein
MKSSLRIGLVVFAFGAFVFTACGDNDHSLNVTPGNSGANGSEDGASVDSRLQCQVLGELCHEADTGSGPAHDCHEVGHDGVAKNCVEEFTSCTFSCVDVGAGGAASRPDALCAALGELCHEVDDLDGPLHECHEAGHDGVAATCAERFDSCATQCLAARAKLEQAERGALSGGAGAGGAP